MGTNAWLWMEEIQKAMDDVAGILVNTTSSIDAIVAHIDKRLTPRVERLILENEALLKRIEALEQQAGINRGGTFGTGISTLPSGPGGTMTINPITWTTPQVP